MKEYIGFYENKHEIVKKSTYDRKYNLQNIINDICSKYRFQISSHDLTRQNRSGFQRNMQATSAHINGNRKPISSIIFILKQLFKMFNLPHESSPHN